METTGDISTGIAIGPPSEIPKTFSRFLDAITRRCSKRILERTSDVISGAISEEIPQILPKGRTSQLRMYGFSDIPNKIFLAKLDTFSQNLVFDFKFNNGAMFSFVENEKRFPLGKKIRRFLDCFSKCAVNDIYKILLCYLIENQNKKKN